MEETISKLQDEYGVRISARAIKFAVSGLRSFAPEFLPEDDNAAVEIVLEAACKMVLEDFENSAHEAAFHNKQYQLRRSLVELNELSRDKAYAETLTWVSRLWTERDSASFYLNDFLDQWDFIGDRFECYRTYASDITSKRINSWLSDRIVRQLLDDIQKKLIDLFKCVLTVNDSHVLRVMSRLADVPITYLPLTRMLPSIDLQKRSAVYLTKQRVVNQEYVIDGIFEILASQRQVTTRPRGSFVLLGPSGVGKTEIAKAVARYWYWDSSRLVEIDMSEYAEPHDLWRHLSEVVERRPYTVFVLDNIDKACSTVIEVLVEVLSRGAPSDGIRGKAVDFSKSIFFMTSNVGSNRFELSCRCYDDQELWKVFTRSPLQFYKNHTCTGNNFRRGRVLVEARKIISADLLDSVDKVLVMERIYNKKAVARLMLRKIVRENYGRRIIVHASSAAIDALFLQAMTYAKTQHLEAGKAFRQALLEHVIPKLHPLVPTAENYGNVSVCIDTLVGTCELSFRSQTHVQDVGDSYFKFHNGTFANSLAYIRMMIETVSKVFSLRRQCLCLLGSDQDFSQVRKLLLEVCNVLSEACSSSNPSPRFWEAYSSRQEIASRDDNLPTLEEKDKFNNVSRELREKNATGIAKATIAILDALVKISDASLQSRKLPSRYFIFEGLNNDATISLINYLMESLGNSFFTYVKLDDNSRGEEVRNMLINQVKERPCMVLLFDGIEFADDVLYK